MYLTTTTDPPPGDGGMPMVAAFACIAALLLFGLGCWCIERRETRLRNEERQLYTEISGDDR